MDINKYCNVMNLQDIQRKLNINYPEAKKFKEQAELLDLFNVIVSRCVICCELIDRNQINSFSCKKKHFEGITNINVLRTAMGCTDFDAL